jgi:hypothetical protein
MREFLDLILEKLNTIILLLTEIRDANVKEDKPPK